MLSLVASLLLAVVPLPDGTLAETCDLIELNWFYDERGKLVFQQTIFYDWSSEYARYNVRDWRLVKTTAQLPQRDWSSGGYVAMWQDGEQFRRLQSKHFCETWTQYDVELLEREILPIEHRRGLRLK